MPRVSASRVRRANGGSRPVRAGSAVAGSAGRHHLLGRVRFSQLGAGGGEERVGEHAGAHVPMPGGPLADLVLVQAEQVSRAI